MDKNQLYNWLNKQFVCPIDKSQLKREGEWYVSAQGRKYPIINETPVFLSNEVAHTAWWAQKSLENALKIAGGKQNFTYPDYVCKGVHPFVQEIVPSTCGHLYKSLQGKLTRYPIPNFPIKGGNHKFVLDIGCNWGRWTFSAAKSNYFAIGVDPSLDAVLAAKQIATQLDLACAFFVGDARYLPFNSETFDTIFSYSVIQHFDKKDAIISLSEFKRLLKNDGRVLIQMPNRYGIRSFYHLAKRGFSEGKNFDVRYYTVSEIKNVFRSVFDNCRVSVDGYFGLGIQSNDFRFMPFFNKIVILLSKLLKNASNYITPLIVLADSLYLESVVNKQSIDIT